MEPQTFFLLEKQTPVSSIVGKKRGLGRLLVSCLNGAPSAIVRLLCLRPELEEEPRLRVVYDFNWVVWLG